MSEPNTNVPERVCQRGVDGSAGCGHAEGVDRTGQCIHKLQVDPQTVAVWDDNHCGHRCDFSPAPPVEDGTHELKPDDAGQVYYPGIVDQKTLAVCLETTEQIIREPKPDRVERFQRAKAKIIAQVKAHPLSFDEWNNDPNRSIHAVYQSAPVHKVSEQNEASHIFAGLVHDLPTEPQRRTNSVPEPPARVWLHSSMGYWAAWKAGYRNGYWDGKNEQPKRVKIEGDTNGK